MSVLNTVTLLLNGLTVALSLSFLVITLWQDTRKELNQFFAIFLFTVTLWNIGSLLTQAAALVEADTAFAAFSTSIMELGFTSSSIAIYALTAVRVGVHSRRFRVLAFAALVLVMGYQGWLIVTGVPIPLERIESGVFTYQPQLPSVFFYMIFDSAAFVLVWRYRRKIRSSGFVAGVMLFVIGQSIGLLNPQLRAFAISINMSSIAALIISFALLRQEIIVPLADRVRQIEAMHQVSLAITSQIAIDTVLDEIAVQAAGWLAADAAGIYLTKSATELELATVYNLPRQYLHMRVNLEQGMVGEVARRRESIFVENYRRDWTGAVDMPLAAETFGSVICVPLIYSSDVIGVLMVVAGPQGSLFSHEDVYLLDLLAAQAAAAIAHSQLFADQHKLTQAVEAARSQLETVLVSTENPVIAINRQSRLIFANPAARQLLKLDADADGIHINEIVPVGSLPGRYRDVLESIRRQRTHIYEVKVEGKTYMCHIASLGGPRISGWVAVLNDVTELKELDRLKSEMVRMTSHDLKNPLFAAMSNYELLQDDLMHVDDAEIQHSMREIGRQLDRMHRIINSILDLERIKHGVPIMEACDPAEIVRNTVDELAHLAADRQIALTSHIDPQKVSFLADQQQFERALINIVENAIKFTDIGGAVFIHTEVEDGGIVFTVKDTGVGIPAAIQPRVFERFYRGNQKGVEHISGSGLGLSIVKTIVENHNGRVWLESEIGVGTTFYICVPAITGQDKESIINE